jgi:site-specific recombinase XerD
MSLNQQIQQFKTYLEVQKQRSNHTVNSYISDINQFFTIAKLDQVTEISKQHIDHYLYELKDLNSKSIHRKLCALDHFYGFLVEHQTVNHNPWKTIRKPRLKTNLPNYLEESTIIELLDNYPVETNEQIRNKALLELLFCSGIRVSECISLSIDDINFESLECKITGKGDKERIVLFGHRCKQWLLHYLNDVHVNWANNQSALFISKNGQRITQRTVQRIVKDANQYHSSSIEITPHTCRHSCASMLLTNGANIRDIQDLLGHSSIMTTQRYANIPTKKLTERFLDAMK